MYPARDRAGVCCVGVAGGSRSRYLLQPSVESRHEVGPVHDRLPHGRRPVHSDSRYAERDGTGRFGLGFHVDFVTTRNAPTSMVRYNYKLYDRPIFYCVAISKECVLAKWHFGPTLWGNKLTTFAISTGTCRHATWYGLSVSNTDLAIFEMIRPYHLVIRI